MSKRARESITEVDRAAAASRVSLDQRQSWDVGEILAIEGPQGGLLSDRAGGDREVDFATTGALDVFIEASGCRRFARPERDCGLGRKQQLLIGQLLGPPRSAQPFVQDQSADEHAFAAVDGLTQSRQRSAVAG